MKTLTLSPKSIEVGDVMVNTYESEIEGELTFTERVTIEHICLSPFSECLYLATDSSGTTYGIPCWATRSIERE